MGILIHSVGPSSSRTGQPVFLWPLHWPCSLLAFPRESVTIPTIVAHTLAKVASPRQRRPDRPGGTATRVPKPSLAVKRYGNRRQHRNALI